ncbi:ferrous iron transporter B [soil metagenome]
MTACHADGAPRRDDGPVDVEVALIGRPNSGKSSLYNTITGGTAKVGNFPGITVDLLEGKAKLPAGGSARVIDVPGMYSVLAAVDPESDEGQARAAIERLEQSKDNVVFVQVIDVTQLALGLRLSAELRAREKQLLVVLTQRDVLDGLGRVVDSDALARALDVPVVLVSANEEAARAVVLAAIEQLARPRESSPYRAPGERPAIEPEKLARSVLSDHPAAADRERRRRLLTERADRILLHPVLGPICFLGIMALLFAAVFLIADPVTAVLDAGRGWLATRIEHVLGRGWVSSLLGDAILGGAGTVLAFLPQIVILTVALEIIDASCYLARGAFLVDRALRMVGLGGRSFVPLLTAHACAIPAIAATRVVRDPKERLRTILVLPLMTCSARLPTYSLLITTFFPHWSAPARALLFVGLYVAGIFSGFAAASVIGKTIQRGTRSLPLVLEMPSYRIPRARVVLETATRAAKRFVRDVGTVILAAAVVLWLLLRIPMPGVTPPATDATTSVETARIDASIAGTLGRALEPITKPVGFDWRINVGLIGSFGARELMVSTLGVIFGVEEVDTGDAESRTLGERIRAAKDARGKPSYSIATAASLLAFFVLACQCMSTVAAIRREKKSYKWPAFVLGYTYVLAYAASFVVFHVVNAFTG